MSGVPIQTIGDLVQELLRHPDISGFADILARYQVPSRDLEPYFNWNPKHYTRNCVFRNQEFEFLVICYEPGQRTSIHDYDSKMAWIHPVIGQVHEERFKALSDGRITPDGETQVLSGDMELIMDGRSIRRFSNPGPGRAVTLNLYARPMSSWRVYDERTGDARSVPAGPPR